MSFLSRKPARPNGRGRGDGYDDYADDGYAQSGDDGWSPNEYFSPEGIKGRWAGETPAGRSGGRGQRHAGHDSGRNRNSYGSGFDGPEQRGTGSPGGTGYGADEFPSGVYDLPDGADEERGDRRRGRRSRDREDRGERTGILRLRRDRGEDIWPDDGISDEDYWASVAADRPLSGSDSPLDGGPAAGGTRSGAASRPGMNSRAEADARFGGDQRGSERGGAGRLGPPPGLSADYQPGGAPGGGSPGGPSQHGRPGRTGSGPMPARPGTGAHPARPGTGPTPSVGVTSSRPPARTGPAKPGSGSGGFPQAPARPSFQPNGSRSGGQSGGGPGSGPGNGRQQDWGDRTERMDRVNAAGYPEPRPGGRGQGPGPADERGMSGPHRFGPGSPGGPRASGPSRALGAPERGRGDAPDWRAPDRQAPDRRAPGGDTGRHAPDRRAPGGDTGRAASGSWPTAAPARGGTQARSGDDPLTSKAYSRAAMTETDGRSYRVAARRSQAQAQLTEQAETFIRGGYQQPAQDQPGRGGEYWQYRENTHAPAPQGPDGRYPVPGDQGGHPSQPGRGQVGQGPAGPGQAGTAPAPGRAAQPAFTPGGTGRPGLPGVGSGHGSGLPGGQYEAQQWPARPQLPTAGLPAADLSGGTAGYAASGPEAGRPAGTGGLNPYDSAITGSYPYSSQPYPALPALGGPAQYAAGDPYYQPSPGPGYPADAYPGPSQGQTDQGRPGYGGYPGPERRY